MTSLDVKDEGMISDGNGGVPDAGVATNGDWNVFATNYDLSFQDRGNNNITTSTNLESFFSSSLNDNSEANVFDPRLIYDQSEDQFVIISCVREKSNDNGYYVIGVSSTTDPNDDWYTYRIPLYDDNWPDFPGLALDEDFVYVTADIIQFNTSGQYNQFLTLKKTDMYAGNGLDYSRLNKLKTESGNVASRIMPCHNHESPNNKAWLIHAYRGGGQKLTVVEVDDPYSTNSYTTYGVDVRDYDDTPNTADQPDVSQELEINGSEFLRRGIVANGSLYCAHSVGGDFNGDGDKESLIRWYEIDLSNFSVVNSSGFGREDEYFFNSALQYDEYDGFIIPYTRSGPNTTPLIGMAGRRNADSSHSYKNLRSGESSYTQQNFGDYYAIARDPSNDSRFSVYGQYPETTSNDENWGMWFGEVELSQ